ncbi:bifunctional adenosylcobinamide kinase/adenosylcobinamide-phosphate guanylyltransferase [Synechococcus sp. CS-1325]|nr:bifunctional adenosylcobinamide kinase/adenosylcobinamide-phosphate guanylyltransferase [Synechococcus sp. CS-1325]MCT0199340.1 bifunctional adenosylcobinamide kinase/adenosylcobinamide-phosphate guanylyltransferase [Synechococcus sp. CS-1325]PZV00149.1 MAG: bifunctional adenosylcobinamide kinase/adenosylcobinamide-phosphate guanylyltransferase [Cyanobium sp.]
MAVAEPGLTLVTGPGRGGKSRWAEHLAASSSLPVIYLATGPLREGDQGWQQRLSLHRQRRPASWPTWEVAGALSQALDQAEPGQLLLIDSLGTWLAHHLELDAGDWSDCQAELLEALLRCRSDQLIVCEEVGWGVVPATAIGGLFRDRLGELQQQLHQRCQASWLVVHGRAINLLALSQQVPCG